jgi:hypothetical protein
VTGLVSRYSFGEVRVIEANGEPAIWMTLGDQDQLVTLDVRDGRVHQIFGILNPDKLAYIRPNSINSGRECGSARSSGQPSLRVGHLGLASESS